MKNKTPFEKLLIGMSISKTNEIHDYIQIIGSNETIISIFNKWNLKGSTLDKINGLKILSIETKKDEVLFTMSDETTLSVSLKDCDFSSPEALTIDFADEPTIVWN